MVPDSVFIAISILTIGSGIALFLFRRLLHAVLALTLAFVGSALVFLYLHQPFVALLQLFVFVGGLSTYLVVAVAAEETKGKSYLIEYIAMLAILGFWFAGVLAISTGLNTVSAGKNFTALLGPALESYYPILFVLALLLFATVIGSILIMKRFVRLVV